MSNSISHFSESIVGFSEHKEVNPKDITVCYSVRCGEINPWVITRIEAVFGYYDPMPNIMIVDFGSLSEYASVIKRICDENDAEYVYVDDSDVFSLAKARNIGVSSVSTDFILLADIDYVYERNIFSRLSSLANRLDLRRNPLKVLSMPIFHVNEEYTNKFEALNNHCEKDRLLGKFESDFLGTKFGDVFEFVAPYSNSIFLHKKMFDLSGGYCDEFRGHGSEDFEFLIRLAKLTSNVPIPEALEKDFYGPLKSSFWGRKNYLGFRRYLEAFTLPCELLGLKTFHLWHPKPAEKGYWTQGNDWKRERFNSVLNRHSASHSQLLEVDYLSREKKALCIFSDKSQWGYFLPLRSAGYRLYALSEKTDDAIVDAIRKIERKEVDRVFIFNPYMKSHAAFRGVIEIAKKVGVQLTVIERGGLPNSIYFSDEVAYGDLDYKKIPDLLESIVFSKEQLSFTSELINNLCSGTYSLESMDPYEHTWTKHALIRLNDKKKIFIPLQLRDDMAVNYFTEGFGSYESYENGIKDAVMKYPDLLFIIKEHPLSKYDLSWVKEYPNVVCADQHDNVHTLIDIADCVALYNSGVGLLAMAHNKKLYHIGNAYYAANGMFSTHKQSLGEVAEEVEKSSRGEIESDRDINKVLAFFSWLVFHKYSWFTADDVVREFADRKSHGYDNINVSVMNLDSKAYYLGNRSCTNLYSHESYLNWHSNISGVESTPEPVEKEKEPIKKIKARPTVTGRVMIIILSAFLNGPKKIKIKNNPDSFFKDSKSAIIKKLAVYHLRNEFYVPYERPVHYGAFHHFMVSNL